VEAADDGLEVLLATTEEEVEAALDLRLRVFSAEQGIAREADTDGLDPMASQVIALRRGNVVGTCRLRFPRGRGKLERMAVDQTLRRTGIGSRLVACAEEEARRRGAVEMTLHAQLESVPFYAACGYEPEGETFLEEGIPHLLMRKDLEGAGAG
jgi:predicted GNAT family N-acyltransferase